MEHKIIKEIFKNHNEARDFLANNPETILKGSELIEKEFKILKKSVDILLRKEDVYYFVEIKDRQSIYVARSQLSRYGRLFERFGPESKKMKYIIVKIQKYLGTDVFYYEDIDDLLNRKNNYEEIHQKRAKETQELPEIKKKWEKSWKDSKEKWRKNHAAGMERLRKRRANGSN